MSRPVQSADLYTDFSGFARLRAEAREGSREGARGAAEQMEAVLLGMMIKSMRAGAGAGLTGTEAGTQQSMYDSQMAQNLAKSGKLGFARMMLAELAPGVDSAPGAGVTPAAATPSPAGYPAPARIRLLDVHPVAAPMPPVTRVAVVAAPNIGDHHPGAGAGAGADIAPPRLAPVGVNPSGSRLLDVHPVAAPMPPATRVAAASAPNPGDHHPGAGAGAAIVPPPLAPAGVNRWSPGSHPDADAVTAAVPAPVSPAGLNRWPPGNHPDSSGHPSGHPSNDSISTAAAGRGDQHPSIAPPAAVEAPATAVAGRPAAWSDPDEFARDLWPAAIRAARELGTEPEAVLAVAALETGWGQHMPRTRNGEPSFNLFGIKAHRRATNWQGEVIHKPTLEFEHGAFTRKVEPFRSYDSPDAAFQDFVAFIKAQPRYSEALDQAADPVAFVHALHKAGYATDPRYGSKLESLISGGILGRARLAAADAATMVS